MPINRVTIVGNLTRDPELRGLPSGGSVCSLRVAVNERRKNGQTGEWDDVPNFFNVTVFGNSADATAKFLSKGRQVAVDGRLRWREFQDKDGNRREAIEIVAQDVQFIGGREGGPGGGGQAGGGQSDDWGGGGGGGNGGGGGGFNGPGASYPVDQGDFGGGQPAPAQGGGWSNEGPRSAPAPAAAPAADDDIPF